MGKFENPFDKKDTRQRVNTTSGFKYDSKRHQYTLDGVELRSVTTLISEYTKPFEALYISEKTATKNLANGFKYLTTGADVRKYWSMKGERASSAGTSAHAFCTMYALDPIQTKPVNDLERNAKKLMDALAGRFRIVDVETSRGNRKYMLGYTMDLVLEDLVTKDLFIGDYKFSEFFTAEQYKEIKGRNAEKMLGIFSDFRAIGYDKGSIQLEVYKRLYELDFGKKIAGCLLFHVDGMAGNDRNFYGDKGYKVYKIQNCVSQVDELLKTQEGIKVLTDKL